MNKQTLVNDLRKAANGAEFVNRQQIKSVRGCGNRAVDCYTQGLPFIRHNRTKLFDVKDVAERMMEFVQY